MEKKTATRTKRTARGPKGGKSRGGKGIWILILLLLIGGFYWYWQSDMGPGEQTGDSGNGAKEKYTVEKGAEGTAMDYTATAQRIHQAVAKGISSAGMTAGENEEGKREVPRQGNDGVIRWHARSTLLKIPAAMTQEKLQQFIQKGLAGTGGEILGTQADHYRGMAVVRMDVGIKDTLGGEALTIITDRLYIAQEGKTETRPPAVLTEEGGGKGRIAFVIDDFGYTQEPIRAFTALRRPVTFAVLPFRPFTQEAANQAIQAGLQVMVHLPMEPLQSSEQSEPNTIMTHMGDSTIADLAVRAIQNVPGASGVNNHQGSKATADRRVMKIVLQTLKNRNMFFIDSRTNGSSVGFDLAGQMGMRTGENELFIDNSADVGAIKSQIRNAAHLALRSGGVIVIGHARPATSTAIREMIPELEGKGIRLVFASQLLR